MIKLFRIRPREASSFRPPLTKGSSSGFAGAFEVGLDRRRFPRRSPRAPRSLRRSSACPAGPQTRGLAPPRRSLVAYGRPNPWSAHGCRREWPWCRAPPRVSSARRRPPLSGEAWRPSPVRRGGRRVRSPCPALVSGAVGGLVAEDVVVGVIHRADTYRSE